MTAAFARMTAIAGIGQTEFSKGANRSETQLACEAILAALTDAGLTVEALVPRPNSPTIAYVRGNAA